MTIYYVKFTLSLILIYYLLFLY